MSVRILIGDVRAKLAELPSDHFDCVVTSPPYWGLRDYDVDGQIGLEPTLGEHLAVMVDVFEHIRRVLKPSGSLWLNYGDCYATAPNGRSAAATKAAGKDDRTFRDKPFSTVGGKLKAKDLCMIPNRLAIALQEAGWWVRSEIVWGKPNPMPDSSGKYRPSTAHEKIFLLTKTGKASYDFEAVAQPVSGNSHSRVARGRETYGRHTLGDAIPEDERRAARPHKMPDGWNTGPGAHGDFHPMGREKGKRPGVTPKSAPEGSNVRAKESFHATTTGMVETRYLRNYEPAPLKVWEMASQAFPDAHFATFPPELAERCLRAGCPAGGTVLDPFGGAGTTGLVADRLGLDCTLIELNPEYAQIARRRIEGDAGMFSAVEVAA
jgi:DNA modification methylase